MKFKNIIAGISALAVMGSCMPVISAYAEETQDNSDYVQSMVERILDEIENNPNKDEANSNIENIINEIYENSDDAEAVITEIKDEIAKEFIFQPDTYTYSFDIPNSENKLVVVEESCLLMCSDDVYLEFPDGKRINIGYFSGDDGHIPITYDEYEMEFSEDSSQVTFTYSFESNMKREDWLSETIEIPQDYLAGDVNRDGVVDIRDVTAVKNHITRINFLDKLSCINADVSDCDGIVDIKDLGQLIKYIIKVVDEF